MSIWRKAHARALAEVKALWRKHGELGVMTIIVSAIAILIVWVFGPEGTAGEELWYKVALTAAILVLTVIIYPVKFISALSALDRESLLKTSALEAEITRLKRPDQGTVMGLRELAVHLHGRVKRFAEMASYYDRQKAVDRAVRDALSLRHIEATGCPKDWINEMIEHHTTRTEIGTEFWKKDGALDWASIDHDDAYERATAVNELGSIVFYDVEFDTAAVTKKWPSNYAKEISFLQLAEVAEGCLGFDFTSRRSHHISFIQGVRQAARLGHLKMLGRARAYDAQKRYADNFPLEPIPADHFSEWSIIVPAGELKRGDDWDIITSKPSANRDECYRELTLADRAQALDWLLSFEPVRQEPTEPETMIGKS